MRIVSTFHPPSSVVGSLKCRLTSGNTEHLVVAMLDRLEVYSVLPEGLVHINRLGVSGRIASIAVAPITGTDRSNVLVLLDQPSPELLLVSLSDGALTFKKSLSLVEQARPAEFLTKVVVDPTGAVAIVSCYIGKLTAVQLRGGEFNPTDATPLNIPELNLLEIVFLPSESLFVVALLHYDSWRRVQLLAREIQFDNGPIPELSSPVDVLPKTVIPNKNLFIPSSETSPYLLPVGTVEEGGGVIVVGGKKVFYYAFADEEERRLLKNKRNRLEKLKNSKDPAEVEKAKEKEKERESRKRKVRHELRWPWGEINAICEIHGTDRWLLGDAFGRLSLLSAGYLSPHGLILIPLGETSPPSSLTYLSNQHLFIGSSKGDSVVLRVSPKSLTQADTLTLPIPSDFVTINPSDLSTASAKGKQKATAMEESDQSLGTIVSIKGSFLQTIQIFKNIGPILDATIFSDSGGETQIVTCSGGSTTGSVNILRNGANYQEVAVVKDIQGIRHIWPISKFFEERTHTHIAFSTSQMTHILRFDQNNSISYYENSSLRGFVTSQPTLAMSNVVRKRDKVYENGTYVVQVTPTSVKLFEHEMGLDNYDQVGKDWLPQNGGRIVSASIHASLIALGIANGASHELIVLKMVDITDQTDTVLEVFGRASVPHEIVAISCAPMDKSAKFTWRVIVAYWKTNAVEIFGFKRPVEKMVSNFLSPPLPSLPQSLLLFNFGSNHQPGPDYHPYLLVGLSNGSVISFSYTIEDDKAKLSDYKSIANLGSAPISLTPCIVDGQNVVFASGSRGSILSWQNQRIRSSTLLLKDVATVSNLNTEQYANSFIVANHTGFSIGKIADLDHMHIRTIPLGAYIPRRILHDPHGHVFGVAINKTEAAPIGGPEPAYDNHFWLLDESTFERLHEFSLPRDEVITALATLDYDDHHYFCVGTYIFKSDEGEPSSGRILILEADTAGSATVLKQITEIQTGGAVYALSTFDHNLLAATIGSAIALFAPEKPDPTADSSLILRKLAEKNQNYVATNLDTHGQTLLVGDMLGSVSSWNVERSRQSKPDNSKFRNTVDKETVGSGIQQKAELSLIKRDYHPLCPTTIMSTDDGGIIGSDLQTNLFSFNKSLERDGHFHLGDMVTKFVRGSLVSTDSSSDGKLEAESIFVTSAGRIGVIVNVKDVETSLHLTNVDRNLRYIAGAAGGTSIAKFRAPRTPFGKATDGAVGFLDGDFLERILTLSPDEVNRVMSGKNPGEKLKMSVEGLKDILEQLQSLH